MDKRLIFVSGILFAVLVLVPQASAGTIISNSADWRDVYSTIIFSKLTGNASYFLVGPAHAQILPYSLSSSDNIEIISSADNPFAIGYDTTLSLLGFSRVRESEYRGVNLELAKRLPEKVTNFIIIDDSYGYNAISVGPYGVVK
ncbi:hypothetical protein J4475_03970, partial [Candidatus Woesearchaeota archaeon]|nr:hypothetical protein [Candidatus Woesearchaeota archaeon]